jgi:uncharacterized protein with PQ loop repeat
MLHHHAATARMLLAEPTMTQALGWIASTILFATIASQVYKQWSDETSKGVSLWLFAGQIAANALFFAYAFTTGDAVFMTANALLLVTSVLGLAIKWKHSRRAGGG